MKFHELDLKKNKSSTRKGRGISAGRGKTAGRGTKGQKSRTGKKIRAGFEGGQNPLMMRIPKLKGFKSWRAKAQVVYVDNLKLAGGKVIDNFTLAEAGLISTPYHSVKIINRGDAPKGVRVSVQNASQSAIESIEGAGGTFTSVEVPKRQKTNKKTDK